MTSLDRDSVVIIELRCIGSKARVGMDMMTEQVSESVGQILRAARESRQIPIEAVAEATRIRMRVLSAIEADDEENLPETPFLIGFVRTYAHYLKIDPEPLIAQVRNQRAEQEDFSLVFPDVEPRRSLPTPALIAAGAAALAMIYGGWFYATDGANRAIAKPAPVTPNKPAAAKVIPAAQLLDADKAKAETVQAPVETVEQQAEPQAGRATAEEAPAEASAAPASAALPLLVASEPVWVAVIDQHGKSIWQGLVEADQRVELPGRGSIALSTGNAGAIALVRPGDRARMLGTRGQIIDAMRISLGS